jgi:hypothetical protein
MQTDKDILYIDCKRNNQNEQSSNQAMTKSIKAGDSTKKTATETKPRSTSAKTRKVSNTKSEPKSTTTQTAPQEKYRDSKYYTEAVSWLLNSIQITMGYDDVRKSIIRDRIPKIKNLSDSATFDGLDKQYEKMLKDYIVNTATKKTPYVIFTAANRASHDTHPETHYQFFFVDNKTHVFYAADPAMVYKQKTGTFTTGVWQPFASEEISAFLSENKIHGHQYRLEYVKTSHPAQTIEGDVFCQTWSLIIMVDFIRAVMEMKGNNYSEILIEIPKNQNERYQKLIDFYKSLTKIPIVNSPGETICDVLTTEYKNSAKKNKNLRAIDPCVLLEQLTVQDIKNW